MQTFHCKSGYQISKEINCTYIKLTFTTVGVSSIGEIKVPLNILKDILFCTAKSEVNINIRHRKKGIKPECGEKMGKGETERI